MNLILILNKVYSCSNDDLKKLKFLESKWRTAKYNEDYNEEDLSDELYVFEQKVIRRSRFLVFGVTI